MVTRRCMDVHVFTLMTDLFTYLCFLVLIWIASEHT